MEQKNHKDLIEAFFKFHKNQPNSVLQLIGDGEKRKDIENMVQEKGIGHSVQFLGLKDNVYEYLHNADIFILENVERHIPLISWIKF